LPQWKEPVPPSFLSPVTQPEDEYNPPEW
jgi:hypothetical protein